MSTATIGSLTVKVRTTARDVTTSGIIYPKEKRASLSEDQRKTILDAAIEKAGPKYDLPKITSIEDTTVNDILSLDNQLKITQDRFTQYDIGSTFTIVYPKSVDKTTGQPSMEIETRTSNLFTDYLSVTPDEVAISCLWYDTWTDDDWYRESNQTTRLFWNKNTTAALNSKVVEILNKYPKHEHGGALYFSIMIGYLVRQSEALAPSLLRKYRSFQISAEIKGENIVTVCTQLRGLTGILHNVKQLPQDYVAIILKIFQTTSVDDFNAMFKATEVQRHLAAIKGHGTLAAATHPAFQRVTGTLDEQQTQLKAQAEHMFQLAETAYLDLCNDNTWTGASSPGSAPSANLSGTQPTEDSINNDKKKKPIRCWNCGKSHNLSDCPSKRDPDKIEANKKAYYDQKKQNNQKNKSRSPPKTGDYRPPEPHEKNRRVIKGKPMFWTNSQRWVDDRNPPSTHTVTNEPIPGQQQQTANSAVDIGSLDEAQKNMLLTLVNTLKNSL